MIGVSLLCRRLAEDGNLRAKHAPLFATLDEVHGRAELPSPSPEAVRSAAALLREAGVAYSPVHSLLKVARLPRSWCLWSCGCIAAEWFLMHMRCRPTRTLVLVMWLLCPAHPDTQSSMYLRGGMERRWCGRCASCTTCWWRHSGRSSRRRVRSSRRCRRSSRRRKPRAGCSQLCTRECRSTPSEEAGDWRELQTAAYSSFCLEE